MQVWLMHLKRSTGGLNDQPVVPSYRLEEADVLSQGPDAAAEGDEEHDHPHHN